MKNVMAGLVPAIHAVMVIKLARCFKLTPFIDPAPCYPNAAAAGVPAPKPPK